MTNNEAEYEAVIAGLKLALKYGARRVVLRCDSQLIVNQVIGTFQIKEQSLQKYQAEIHKLLPEFDECRLDQIPRAQNIEVYGLAKRDTPIGQKGSQKASNAGDQVQHHKPRPIQKNIWRPLSKVPRAEPNKTGPRGGTRRPLRRPYRQPSPRQVPHSSGVLLAHNKKGSS
uniref:Uncharacterized protein LOC104219413 n=1 Tax=Nicotiana sylvestris TaxID=4096 RepID=A0A1U7VK46_NICSY|nr:PREDICTED: uncharacterized protein LOC104219413 [Nicotiana sylvestris]